MKKFNEQQIREDYADGALDEELDAMMDAHYCGLSASELLAELQDLGFARAKMLEQYIASARDAYDGAAIEAYELQKECSDA